MDDMHSVPATWIALRVPFTDTGFEKTLKNEQPFGLNLVFTKMTQGMLERDAPSLRVTVGEDPVCTELSSGLFLKFQELVDDGGGIQAVYTAQDTEPSGGSVPRLTLLSQAVANLIKGERLAQTLTGALEGRTALYDTESQKPECLIDERPVRLAIPIAPSTAGLLDVIKGSILEEGAPDLVIDWSKVELVNLGPTTIEAPLYQAPADLST